MKKYLFFFVLFFFLFFLASCKDNDDPKGLKINNIKGLVEKGPFVSGSSVSIYELDEDLRATGRVFEAKTNDEGGFTLTPSTSFASKYVKLSVNGFYFNEYTGKLSDAPISLEAITSIENVDADVNVNVLTHLEMPRVMKLVSTGVSFEAAKQQAQQEILKVFLITGQTLSPEKTSITANNTSANILIAISSILLNNRSDASFTEFMSTLRSDLEDGQISDNTKSKIASSSFGLNYTRIKKSIQDRYEELGKTVAVGNFELFIDGDGDGEIGDGYEEELINVIIDDNIFNTEDNVKKFCAGLAVRMYSFIQNQDLFDGVYANTVTADKLNKYNELRSIYDHDLKSQMFLPYDLWKTAYQSIRFDDKLVEKSRESNQDWFKKYQYYGTTYRAYKYLAMINLWGDVPLISEPYGWEKASVAPPYLLRTSEAEILDYVISELEDAYKYLPESSFQYACSKYFAKAVQARAYLQKKDYNKALACLNLIINSGKYSLESNPSAIYAGGSKEMIFEFPNSDEYSTLPYRELVQKGANISVSRYAEVLLMAAEANMQLGNNTQAINYLNQVRSRNGRSPLNGTSDVKAALLNEYREDLKNEGLYFSALKRHDKAKEVLNIEDYKLLLPIPQQEIDLNSYLKQNPGY